MTTEHEANRTRIKELETVVSALCYYLGDSNPSAEARSYLRTLAELANSEHGIDYRATERKDGLDAVELSVDRLIDALMKRNPDRPDPRPFWERLMRYGR